MRLVGHSKTEAWTELVDIIRKHPEGIRTSALRGTPKFHGSRTLSNSQIINLLRPLSLVTAHIGGQGMRTYLVWKINEPAYENYQKNLRAQAQEIIDSWK